LAVSGIGQVELGECAVRKRIMDKLFKDPWYLASIGFIILGIYLLKLWRKSIDPKASPWDRILTEKLTLFRELEQ